MTSVALVLFIGSMLLLFGIACVLTYRRGYRQGDAEMDAILARMRQANEELEHLCRRLR